MASVCLACLIVVTTVDGHPSRELEQHVPPGDCSCYSYCCRYYYDTVDPGETITMLTDVAYPQSVGISKFFLRFSAEGTGLGEFPVSSKQLVVWVPTQGLNY